MCGLIAAFHAGSKKDQPVNDFIINQYEDQHIRGQKGFGITRITPEKPVEIDRATEPVKMMLDLYTNPSPMMIFHHRTPTSTDNKMAQTHPIVVDDPTFSKKYLVTHNGVISNDDDLKELHESLGIVYKTEYTEMYTNTEWSKFNDSEAFGIEMARYLEGQTDTIAVGGSAAFIVLACNKEWIPETLYFGRNDRNPLNMSKSREHMYLSSEGAGNELTAFTMYSMKIGDPKMELKKKKFTMNSYHIPKPIPAIPRLTENTDIKQQQVALELKNAGKPAEKDKKDEYDFDDDVNESYMECMEVIDAFYTELDTNQHGLLPDMTSTLNEVSRILQEAYDKKEKETVDDESIRDAKLEAELEDMRMGSSRNYMGF